MTRISESWSSRSAGLQLDPVEQVLDAPVVRGACAPDDAVDLVAFAEEQLREIGAVLTGDAADERPLSHDDARVYSNRVEW